MLKIIDFQKETEKPRKRYRGSRGNKESRGGFIEQYSALYDSRYAILGGILSGINVSKKSFVIKEYIELDWLPIEIDDVTDYPYEEGIDQLLDTEGAHLPCSIVPEDWYRTADPYEIDGTE